MGLVVLLAACEKFLSTTRNQQDWRCIRDGFQNFKIF